MVMITKRVQVSIWIPTTGKVDMTVACKKEEGLARIKLINCNAIVENVSVDILQEDRSNYEGIEIKEYNGEKMGDRVTIS